MSLLTGFLPVEQGVAAYAALDHAARALRATGDARSLGQIMADTLVERVTGQADAAAVPVEVGVVLSLDTLVGRSTTQPARVGAPGTVGIPVPAAVATDLVDMSQRLGAPVWLRRLLTDPVDHTLTTLDTKRRRYTGGLATLITRRDQTCRTPYCTAPIRHLDHVTPWRTTGSTTAHGGQGLCVTHNLTKESPGWHTAVAPPTTRHPPHHHHHHPDRALVQIPRPTRPRTVATARQDGPTVQTSKRPDRSRANPEACLLDGRARTG